MTSTESNGYNGINYRCENSPKREKNVTNTERMYAQNAESVCSRNNNMADVKRSVDSDVTQRSGVRNKTSSIARDLAYDIICHNTGVTTKKVKKINNKYSKTLERTVDQLTEKHQIYLSSAVKKLNATEEDAHTTIDNVANEMFVDKQFNWGRLVTLYAFCGKMAKYLVEKYPKRQSDIVDKIADYTAEYVSDVLSSHIDRYGGWEAFVDFFPEPNRTENTVWRGLIYTVVGLGALATMVAAR